MSHYTAIETEYRNNKYASRLEARWAMFFHLSGIDVLYEPSGANQLPDFKIYLPTGGNFLFEVKGKYPNLNYRETLFKRNVFVIAIGGFFRYKKPLIYQLKAKGSVVKPLDFKDLFYFAQGNTYEAFRAACSHCFDLD